MTTSAAATASATVGHPQAGLGGQGAALGRLLEPDDDVDAGVVQVQRVGVALAAVADDGDGLAGQRRGSASAS